MSALYRRVLGDALDALPAQLRALHDSDEPRRWCGRAEVRRGSGILSRLVGWGMRLPRQSSDVAVSVTFTPQDQGEVWQRDFGGVLFQSYQYVRPGADPGVIQERFGWIDVSVALQVDRDRLVLTPRGWSIFGVSLPRALLPSGESFETQVDGRFVFDVEIAVPWVGRIAAYRGWLLPDKSQM